MEKQKVRKPKDRKSVEIAQENKRLLLEYSISKDIAVRNKIVELNINLVRSIAHKLNHQCKENFEDLVQIGVIGLISAIDRFDPTKEFKLSSYATPYIWGEISHWQRDRGKLVRLPCKEYELYQRIRKLCKSKAILYLEAAQSFGLSAIEAEALRHCMQENFVQLNASEIKCKDENDQHSAAVLEALASLPELHQKVITEHYYDGATKTHIRKKYNLRLKEIDVILETGVKRLRELIEET